MHLDNAIYDVIFRFLQPVVDQRR